MEIIPDKLLWLFVWFCSPSHKLSCYVLYIGDIFCTTGRIITLCLGSFVLSN